jgi:hypothetical protein
MLTFNGSEDLKRQVIEVASAKAAQVGNTGQLTGRQLIFWSDRKWCFGRDECRPEQVCDHRFYADQIGVPPVLAYAEHSLFLAMSPKAAGQWWPDFLQAIPVGVDLDTAEVWAKLALFVLSDRRFGLITCADDQAQREAMLRVIDLYEQDNKNAGDWREASNEVIKVANWAQIGSLGNGACCAAGFSAHSFVDAASAAYILPWSAKCMQDRTSERFNRSRQNERNDAYDRAQIREEGYRLGLIAYDDHMKRIADLFLGLLRASGHSNRV